MIGEVSNRTVRKRGAMSTFQPKNLWTAFITAFFALLGVAGPRHRHGEHRERHERRGAAERHDPGAHGRHRATPIAPSVRWTLPRDRALPPTMKQRIRAEAHGSSPATRHLSLDPAETARTTGPADSHHTAPEGDSPAPPLIPAPTALRGPWSGSHRPGPFPCARPRAPRTRSARMPPPHGPAAT